VRRKSPRRPLSESVGTVHARPKRSTVYLLAPIHTSPIPLQPRTETLRRRRRHRTEHPRCRPWPLRPARHMQRVAHRRTHTCTAYTVHSVGAHTPWFGRLCRATSPLRAARAGVSQQPPHAPLLSPLELLYLLPRIATANDRTVRRCRAPDGVPDELY